MAAARARFRQARPGAASSILPSSPNSRQILLVASRMGGQSWAAGHRARKTFF